MSDKVRVVVTPEMLKNFKSISDTIQREQLRIAESATLMVKSFRELIKDVIPILSLVPKVIEYYEKAPDAMKILADHGWYLPVEVSLGDIALFGDKINEGKIDRVNKELMDIIDENIDEILSNLLDKYPHRTAPIKAAINAHKRKEYYLSIPVLFAQTDGICKELTEKPFFNSKEISKNKYSTYTYDWANQFRATSILGILVEPLKHKGDFSKHHTEDNFTGITRHSVLHGENTTYGIDINSYKALSLLSYIGSIVYEIANYIE